MNFENLSRPHLHFVNTKWPQDGNKIILTGHELQVFIFVAATSTPMFYTFTDFLSLHTGSAMRISPPLLVKLSDAELSTFEISNECSGVKSKISVIAMYCHCSEVSRLRM